MKHEQFRPIIKPYLHGYFATREDGIDVEIVECYPDQWNIFLTRNDHVVACSLEEYRLCKRGYIPKSIATRIAKTLLK